MFSWWLMLLMYIFSPFTGQFSISCKQHCICFFGTFTAILNLVPKMYEIFLYLLISRPQIWYKFWLQIQLCTHLWFWIPRFFSLHFTGWAKQASLFPSGHIFFPSLFTESLRLSTVISFNYAVSSVIQFSASLFLIPGISLTFLWAQFICASVRIQSGT